MKTLSHQRHWYDGWFYALFIDSGLNDLRQRLLQFIPTDAHVLDIGCGTGGFSLKIAERTKFVTGVDISKKQIDMANKRLKQKKLKNARFVHLHGADLEKINDRTYTHGILSFVIHEMDHSDRLMVLKSAKKIVPQLVILDYHTPHPYSLWGIFTRLIEFLAGNTHYTNFRDYLERNGLNAILDEAGFHIVHHLINRKKVFSTVVAVASEQRKSLT